MKNTTCVTLTIGLLALSSCENPADNVVDATVSEAAEAAPSQGGQRYVFDKDSTIGFTGSKVTGSHSGGFRKFTGFFTVKDGEPHSGEFTIDMDSTWSDSEKLTTHLKADDFFDVSEYPESKFVATGFSKESETAYKLSGNLTLHGVTKNITFPATISEDGDTVNVVAEFDIDRHDFGISYAGKKDDLIRSEVVLELDLKAVAE